MQKTRNKTLTPYMASIVWHHLENKIIVVILYIFSYHPMLHT